MHRSCALVLVVAWAAAAQAQEAAEPFEVDLGLDLPLAIGVTAAGLLPELFKGELAGPWCGTSCDPERLNALDRTVVGNHSALADGFSDGLIVTNLALPHLLGAIDRLATSSSGGWRGYGQDTMILAESLAVSFTLNNLVKYAVRRPRPYVYDDTLSDAERTKPDATLSFYSGHTSSSFCMATAYSFLFTERHRGSPLVIPVWLGTHLLAAATGVLRVGAGKHFWTDVLTGAVVGSAVGLIVPWLHRKGGEPPPGQALTADRGSRFSPMVMGNGVGFAWIW